MKFPAKRGQAGASAQDLWYVSTGNWFDRQADLRETMGDEGLGAGVWFRGAFDKSEREQVQSFGNSVFDNANKQTNWALTFGGDIVSTRSDGEGFVAGAMLGYAHADVQFENDPTQQRLSGMTGGVYASCVSAGFYVDAAVNGVGRRLGRIDGLQVRGGHLRCARNLSPPRLVWGFAI